MLLEIKNGTVSRHGVIILRNFHFEIRGNEKAAIVGRNGSGKTTLLEVLSGERSLDADEKHPESGIYKSRAFTAEMLHQSAVPDPEKSVQDELLNIWKRKMKDQKSQNLSLGFSEFELSFDRLFTKFGFVPEDKKRRLRTFSGGEQTKIMLLLVFLLEPEVLLLDEPTNYLDLETTKWLESAIRHYKGAVIYVSHDRYFIDETADVVWDIQKGKLSRYPGNYTSYRKQKKSLTQKQEKAYIAQQKEIRRLEDLIKKFKQRPRKAAFARSRKKMLERMDKIEKPDEAELIHVRKITPKRPGSKLVLDADHLLVGYDTPIKDISFRLRRGQKTGIFGPNGSGKSTFLKTVAGMIPPYSGKLISSPSEMNGEKNSSHGLRIGQHIDPAYFDQFSANIQSEKSVFQWFHDRFPNLLKKDVHTILAGYLFQGSDFGKKVSSLSGGEKARLVLASILYQKPNFLILDEPTSHMDIPSKEAIEDILEQYEGTILFVSHDRYFLKKLSDSLLVFGQGVSDLHYYPYGYETYVRLSREAASGNDLNTAHSAEAQRLIEGLRSVPEKSYLPKELSTTAASFDWEFDLNKKTRESAELRFAKADALLQKMPENETEWENWSSIEADRTFLAENAAAAWTQELIEWYDIWQDTPAGIDSDRADQN